MIGLVLASARARASGSISCSRAAGSGSAASVTMRQSCAPCTIRRRSRSWCRRATRPTASPQSVASLLRQDYPAFSLVLVDDDSDDGTADVARRAAAALGAEQKLTIVPARRCRSDWTGKLWAVKQGIAAAEAAVRAEISDADRCRHRACARHAALARRACGGEAAWCSPRSRRAGAARTWPSACTSRPSSSSSRCSTRSPG